MPEVGKIASSDFSEKELNSVEHMLWQSDTNPEHIFIDGGAWIACCFVDKEYQ